MMGKSKAFIREHESGSARPRAVLEKKKAALKMNVKLSQDLSVTLEVSEGDSPDELSAMFAAEHNLDEDKRAMLGELLTQSMIQHGIYISSST